MRHRLAAALAGVLGLVLAGSAVASARLEKTETARLRRWSVTLTSTFEVRRDFAKLRGLRLQARVGDATRIDRTVPPPRACGDFGCVAFGGSESMLELADLGGGAPTAVVWLWTGGAHCCSVAETVSLADGRVAVHDFGNHGASVVHIGDAHLFSSVDDRFSYLYTSYAASLEPLQLWQLRGTRFVDVTASYRLHIAADERRLWSYVTTLVQRREEVRGAFAAWAADACRLSGPARVESAARPLVAGQAFSPPRTDPLGPTGARFPVVLLRDLTRLGYCRPGHQG